VSTERTQEFYNIQVSRQFEHYSKLEFWSVQVWQTPLSKWGGAGSKKIIWEGTTAYIPNTDAEQYKLLDITLDDLLSTASQLIEGLPRVTFPTNNDDLIALIKGEQK
jgi:hypothetical protein